MDDYVDVVDFEAESAQPVASTSSRPEQTASGRPRRAAAARRLSTPGYSELDDPPAASASTVRATRTGIRLRPGGAPKLKLKLSEKAAALAPGMSFLGQYDRELDSDDEDLTFEEQFILRLPPGEDLDKLRKMVSDRSIVNDVWFKFKGACSPCGDAAMYSNMFSDARRAVFHIGNHLYSAKLVDLPCIIESQKTIDGKQMFKAADICQVLHPFLETHGPFLCYEDAPH
jgi:transcription initiation factor TFIID subunit 7